MEIYKLLFFIALGICALIIVVFAFINHKYSKTLKGLREREVDGVNIKNGVRYTIDQTVVDENGNMNLSFGKEDIILKQNQTEIVGVKNKIKPGKYTLLSSQDDKSEFNIRVGTYVNEYKHNQSIVLSEGQEITAVNCSVILR